MIRVKNLSKSYPGVQNSPPIQILKKINFEVKSNTIVSIVGQSGSGKSTLLNILGLLDSFDDGDVIVDNKSLKSLRKSEHPMYRNQYIGFVFQFHHLMPELTVLENIAIPLLIKGVNKYKAIKKANEVARFVFNEEELTKKKILQQKPSLISGGQRQRSAIARALINDPKIILADEPTGSLDEEWGHEVFNKLLELRKKTTVILVTHNPVLANKTDEIFGLTHGKLEKWPKFQEIREIIDNHSLKYKQENVTCPRCNGVLQLSYIGEESDPSRVEIDICEHCHGVWLDHGELEMITKNYLNFLNNMYLSEANNVVKRISNDLYSKNDHP